jgi:Fe-S-cluster containining protein
MTCGVCCFSTLDDYVAVTGADYARLGDDVDALVRFDGTHAFMRMRDGHCGSLGIDLTTQRFVCRVYETRPDTCRDLARGSGACLGEIETKADRPLSVLGLGPKR